MKYVEMHTLCKDDAGISRFQTLLIDPVKAVAHRQGSTYAAIDLFLSVRACLTDDRSKVKIIIKKS